MFFADAVGKLRRTLFQKCCDAFAHIVALTACIDATAVDFVRFHWMVGTHHAPDHLTHQRAADRCRIVGNFARELACRRDEISGRNNAADQAAFQRFLRIKDAA